MIVIATMDALPDYCYECPCHDGEHSMCKADIEKRAVCEYRPYWCPLKEVNGTMMYVDEQYKMPELLCCPFCGQDTEMHHLKYVGFSQMYWVSCPNCSAEIKNVSETEKEAKDNWNRRVKPYDL